MMISKTLTRLFAASVAMAFLAVSASAYEFCGDSSSWGDKSSARDLREVKIAATGSIEVDGGKNGGISVRGENRSDVLVRACVQAWADSDAEAKNLVDTTRIETSGVIRAIQASEKSNTSVSFEVIVPIQTNLKLSAHNGGISIETVDGTMEFSTTNGGIKLANIAGDVKGRTTNGGVKVELTGMGWRGSGLDVTTTNGGVKLALPANYAANVEAGTVNGGFKSDFPELQVKKSDDDKYSWRNKKVSASINGGGAPIRVSTTNGGVKIGTGEEVKL